MTTLKTFVEMLHARLPASASAALGGALQGVANTLKLSLDSSHVVSSLDELHHVAEVTGHVAGAVDAPPEDVAPAPGAVKLAPESIAAVANAIIAAVEAREAASLAKKPAATPAKPAGKGKGK